MSIISVLIPIAVLFVILGLAIFFWAVKSRQFDDLDKEAFSILFDEKQQKTTSDKNNKPDDNAK
jgi:cbb3-type cytochrome oxidase maturation protein